MEGLERSLGEHPFFAGLSEHYIALVASCATDRQFEAGQYLFHEGESADGVYLVRRGRIGILITVPGRGAVMVHTASAGEIAGVSWLVPPYRWTYDAKALEPVLAIVIDTKCLRQKSEADHAFGYEMMQRFIPVLVDRLHAARLQMLDLYGVRT
jgi:CRP/FNR family transcriptional regulator, cyclic AMP receptor protein